MNDLEALYAAILLHPTDDTPRLIYADALDEAGGADNTARAEFIRKHIELDRIGPKRQLLQNVLLLEAGPDYWVTDCGEADGEIDVGDRVDVVGEEAHAVTPQSNAKKWHGLLVTKAVPGPSGTFELTLKRDAGSVKWDRKLVGKLQGRCQKLLWEYWPDWCRVPPGQPNLAAKYHPEKTRRIGSCVVMRNDCLAPGATSGLYLSMVFNFVCGFASHFHSSWENWENYADDFIRMHPIGRVSLLTPPDGNNTRAGIDIAGQLIPWSYLPTNRPNDDGSWTIDEWQRVLSLRWPTIPQDNWELNWDDE